MDHCASDVEGLDDGDEVMKPDNTRSVLSPSLNRFNHEYEHAFLDAAVRLLNAHLIPTVKDDWLLGI